jgi:hypothetical protein
MITTSLTEQMAKIRTEPCGRHYHRIDDIAGGGRTIRDLPDAPSNAAALMLSLFAVFIVPSFLCLIGLVTLPTQSLPIAGGPNMVSCRMKCSFPLRHFTACIRSAQKIGKPSQAEFIAASH